MKMTILIVSIILASISLSAQQQYQGAWEAQRGDTTFTMIIADDYLSIAMFDSTDKTFYRTTGGTIDSYNGELKGLTEFDSHDKSIIGKEFRYSLWGKGDKLEMERYGKMSWKKLDDGTKNISGNWRITQREQNGKLASIHTTGPRKTIKIMSSTRFQWAAINTETGEFSGTGGGRYTWIDGKYTEHILFFSRDASRVGMSLSFQANLEGKDWYHSGKSSKGDPINEVWSRN